MTVAHENPGSRVNLACKALMRYIRARNLGPKDKLPPQKELRAELRFSNDTLTSAMKRLVASGMLVRRTGAGTILADDSPATIRSLWTVGILLHPTTAMLHMPFWAQLTQSLHSRIVGGGYEVRQFGMKGEIDHLPGQADFPGLPEAIGARRVDALVTLPWFEPGDWAEVRRQGVGMCSAGPWESAPCGVIIDQKPGVAWAVRRLVEHGCRRLAVVSENVPSPGFERFWVGFEQGLASVRAAHEVHGFEPVPALASGGYGGQRVAERLLALPADERPDGLIVIEDQLALGLTTTLLHSDYRPAIVIQANRQAALSMALPVFRYEVDIEALAEQAVELLLDQLYAPQAPPEVRWYEPVPLEAPADIHPIRSDSPASLAMV